METARTKRKLVAILMADVVGYSRLMGQDEQATLRTLTAYREFFRTQIERHEGRVVNAPGDSILAEFGSVVDAVAAAVEIQRKLAEKNAELPSERAMHFRVGINLGDVLLQDDAIYGDGVNIAARLESLADPGGIAISRSAFDQVDGKLPIDWEYTGEHNVKNIRKPVRAYRLLISDRPDSEADSAGLGAMPGEDITQELNPPTVPDQPSIAVLPFVNMSGDPEQEYFSDGITEDLITDLSKLPRLLVIARNSSFVYKGRPTDVRKVGVELGVRYVLEGSVRKADDRVRITAQLVDTTSGEHLWAHRYDRDLQDIFALQDEITSELATELEVKLVEGERAREWRRSTSNLEAYDLALRGRDLYLRFNRSDYTRGRRLLEKALELDPGFSYAMYLLAWTYVVEGMSGRSGAPVACFDRAVELGNEALALDDSFAEGYTLLASALLKKGEHDRAVEYAERAVALNPDDVDANGILAYVLENVGRGAEALEWIETAIRLNPFPQGTYLGNLAGVYKSLGRFNDAIAAYRKCLERIPDYLPAQLGLVIAYMETGREHRGRAQARQVLRIDPDFSASSSYYVLQIKDPATRKRYVTLLHKAGLPE